MLSDEEPDKINNSNHITNWIIFSYLIYPLYISCALSIYRLRLPATNNHGPYYISNIQHLAQSGFYTERLPNIVNILENGLYKKLLYLLHASLGRQVLARFPCSNPTLAKPPNNYNLTDKITYIKYCANPFRISRIFT